MDPVKLNALVIELLEVLHEQAVELDHAFEQVGRTAGRVPESRHLTATASRLAGLQLRARQLQDDWVTGVIGRAKSESRVAPEASAVE